MFLSISSEADRPATIPQFNRDAVVRTKFLHNPIIFQEARYLKTLWICQQIFPPRSFNHNKGCYGITDVWTWPRKVCRFNRGVPENRWFVWWKHDAKEKRGDVTHVTHRQKTHISKYGSILWIRWTPLGNIAIYWDEGVKSVWPKDFPVIASS